MWRTARISQRHGQGPALGVLWRCIILRIIIVCVAEAQASSGSNRLDTNARRSGKEAVRMFHLADVQGNIVSPENDPKAKGCIIIFTCNHCPFAKLYPERLNALANKYAPLHVPLIAVNSVDSLLFSEENIAEMQSVWKQQKWNFPYVQDATQSVARDFGADKTPHAFVLKKNATGWFIVYEGAIDDNGAEPAKVKRRYVEEAVESILHGTPLRTRHTASIGCAIRLRQQQ